MELEIKYNLEDDILLVWFSQENIYDARMTGSTIMHVSEGGEPVLLEILDASVFVGDLSSTIERARTDAEANKNAA